MIRAGRVSRCGANSTVVLAYQFLAGQTLVTERLRATIALVRIPRSELPPKEDRLAQAEKYL